MRGLNSSGLALLGGTILGQLRTADGKYPWHRREVPVLLGGMTNADEPTRDANCPRGEGVWTREGGSFNELHCG